MQTAGPATDGSGTTRPLRRDAARNRERIVEAARELYATRGLGVGLNEVAHHAGLGVGTVYRRFPVKEDLVRAALSEPLREMTEVAQQAMATERAWDGLVLLLERGAALLTANLGVRDVALGLDSDAREDLGPLVEDFAGLGDTLMSRAREQGDLRPGVTGDDLVLVLWMVTEVAVHSAQSQPGAYRRYLQMVMDGLRDGPGRRPLDEPVDHEAAAQIARHWAAR